MKLTPEKRRAITSLGGRAVKPENRTFTKRPEVQKAAASKGGKSVPPASRTYSRDPELARRAAAKGVATRRAKIRQRRESAQEIAK